MSSNLASNIKFYSDYSRWVEEDHRTESWEDSVQRIMDMHKTKYADKIKEHPELEKHLKLVHSTYVDKKMLGSQRALQFGGAPILSHNSKMYNCLSSYCDRVEFFQEAMYWLLSGCGIGFSVQWHHIARLPGIQTRDKGVKTFVVEDSIEGWSDAFGVLVSSYVSKNPTFEEYQGFRVDFDLSNIRPKGAKISGGFKAPGPEGLRKSLIKCQELLDRELKNSVTNIRSIVAYDFVMHMSDAVLSGGVRRSATICIFSHDDKDMLTAKTGNWSSENPQRGRSNNSAALIRGEVTKEEFEELFESVRQYGEPGFVFLSHRDIMYNPCVEIGMFPQTEDGESGWQGCNL